MALARNDSGYAGDYGGACSEKDYAPRAHHLRDFIAAQTDDYVLQNWDFEDNESSQEFLNKRVSNVACLYFPAALDERIVLIARLFSILYLTGENLASLDLDDSEDYIGALESAIKGYWSPDESIPAVWMLCGVFDEMRTQDYVVVDDVIETTMAHLRANLLRRGRTTQRHDSRSAFRTFRIGASLISALTPFAMGTDGFE